jgi:hypothetical protein
MAPVYWRIKGTVIFTTDPRRRAFMNNLVAFLGQAGITVLVDNRIEYTDPLGPACRVDVCAQENGQMDTLWNTCAQWNKNYIIKMDVVKHRCTAYFGEDPAVGPDNPTAENIYFRWP